MARGFRSCLWLIAGLTAVGCTNLPLPAPNTQSSRTSTDTVGVSQWQSTIPTSSPPSSGNLNFAQPISRTTFAEFQNSANYPTDTTFAGNNEPTAPNGAALASWRGQGPDGTLALNPSDDNDFPFADGKRGIQPGQQTMPGGPNYQPGPGMHPERLPQPMPGAAVGSAANPNVRTQPTAGGQWLALGQNETAADRAVMLAQVLEKTQAEATTLRERIRTLEAQQLVLERARADGAQVADQAANEMARARTQMETLHGEVVALRERLRRLDRQDIDTLREIIDGLEGLLHEDGSKKQ
jgi:hypothetical protein